MPQNNIVNYFCGNGMLMTPRIPNWWMCTHHGCRQPAAVGCPYIFGDSDHERNVCSCGRGACKTHLGEDTTYAS